MKRQKLITRNYTFALISILLQSAIGFTQPSWLEETTLFGDTPIPGRFQGVPAVHVWGETIEYPERKMQFKREADIVHKENGYYVGTISAFSPEPEAYEEVPQILDARVIDINNQLSEIKWKTSDEEPVYFFNTNLSIYQNYLRQQMYDLIDAGADAIMIDEIEGTAGTIHRGGSFGPVDMAMFNDYLLEQYTAEQLQSWFGIDIETFDYGDWIREKGLQQTWENKPWNVTLYNDYRYFQRERIKVVMTALIEDARNYAQTTYGKDIAFSANIFGFHPHQMLFSDLLDYFTVEYGYRADLFAPDGHATPFLKYANNRGKPSILLPSVYTGNLIHDWDTDDILRLWTMEAYATGNAFMNARGFFAGKDDVTGEFLELLPNMEERQETFHFIEDNHHIFSPDGYADVALLYSFATDHINWTREDWAGTAYALLDSHIQYDVVSLGSEPWLDETLSLSSLSGYDAVVLASAKNMSEQQINILQQYVDTGGTLVVVGDEAGGFNMKNQRFEYPDWEAMTALGERSYGSGNVKVLPNTWGMEYFETRNGSMLPDLIDPILAAADPVTKTDAPSTLHLLASLGSRGVSAGNSLMVHALNYDFDMDSQQILPTAPFQLELTLPEEIRNSDFQVYEYRVGENPQRVSYQPVNGGIRLNVSSVKVYAGWAILLTSDARQIADAAIAEMDDALSNATSEVASTQEIVDGEANIAHLYGQKLYMEAQSEAISVLSQIKDLSRKTILHTERNGEISSISLDRAALIFPGRPEKAYLGELQARLNDEYVFLTDTENWLSEQDLSQYDIVMISSPWSHFQEVEKTALMNYIWEGGSALLLGNPFRNGALNPLLADFNITVHEEALSIKEGVDFGAMSLMLNESAPEGLPDTALVTNWPTRLTVSGNSQVVATSGSQGWLDELEINQQLDPGESQGDFPMAATATYGNGRLFVLADTPFDDAMLSVYRNDVFLRDVFGWLTDVEQSSMFSLNVSSQGTGWVDISPDHSTYFPDTQVTLTANPGSGYSFQGWTGDISSTQNPLVFSMTGNTSVTAKFQPLGEVPTITSEPVSRIVNGSSQIILEVESTGTNLQYQWYFGWSGDVSTPIQGATDSLLVLKELGDSISYLWCRVSNSQGTDDTSTIILASGLEEGWVINDLGLVNVSDWPLVFHSEFGWLYSLSSSPNPEFSGWFYAMHPQLSGWLWTDASMGPWVYMNAPGSEFDDLEWFWYDLEHSTLDWESFFFLPVNDSGQYNQYIQGTDSW